ncbi:hypothetical protein VNO80_33909 [Phaseolus coccineus]|uniref:Uncharacterized protein n=1 Tax=Phaseolus coccineus TaxID=3886 RepID=A0AAN9KXU8_PHACN
MVLFMANTRLRRKGPDNLLLKEGSSHIAAEANLAVVAPPANPLPAVAPARMTNQEVAMIRQQVGKENHDMMLRMIQQAHPTVWECALDQEAWGRSGEPKQDCSSSELQLEQCWGRGGRSCYQYSIGNAQAGGMFTRTCFRVK